MLRWREHPHDSIWWLDCGDRQVAQIDYDGWEEEPDACRWKLLVDNGFTKGQADSFPAATTAAETAFSAWLQSANLVQREMVYAAVQAEREACAEAAEKFDRNREWVPGSLYDTLRREVAGKIRRRSEIASVAMSETTMLAAATPPQQDGGGDGL